MKNKSFIYLGIGAAVLLYLLSKKSAAKNLRIYFQTIGTKKSTGLNFPTITATFRIVNPTSSILTIDSIVGDLMINNKLLSTFNFRKGKYNLNYFCVLAYICYAIKILLKYVYW